MVKIKVPSATDTAGKWSEEAPKRATYYEKNTPPAAADWEAGATAAAGNYKAAVSAANIDKLFAGGIKRVGSEKFARKVKDVGVSRFGPGITAAKDDYEKAVAPFLGEIAATDIAARKPRGDPANFDRVTKIGTALHKKRLSLLAAGPSS